MAMFDRDLIYDCFNKLVYGDDRRDTDILKNCCWQDYNRNGAPDWIRTSGPQIRNLMLYPAELRVH
jgi:hypothetical protein